MSAGDVGGNGARNGSGRIPLTLPARLFFRWRERSLVRRHLRRLRAGDDLRLTATHSRTSYEAYDHREQEAWANGSVRTLDRGRIRKVPFREIRDLYLEPVIRHISELEKEGGRNGPVRVLEVGCGNCINMALLNRHFGDRVELHGIDLSPRRMEVSRQYWKESLQGVSLSEMSVLEIAHPDNAFDLVFSMHVLEQIPLRVGEAMDEMLRVASRRVVFVEPTYEFGNAAQRLKLILNDQLQYLLPEIERRQLDLIESWPLETLANPTSPSGVHVVSV